VGAVAHAGDGGLGGADQAHDLRVLQFGVVAHQPQDRARPLVPARHRGIARALLLGGRRQRHLALAEFQAVIRVLFALFDLVAGELAGRNRVHALDALGGVAVGDGADLQRVHFGEIGNLVGAVLSTSHTAVAFGISGALLMANLLCASPTPGGRSRGHQR